MIGTNAYLKQPPQMDYVFIAAVRKASEEARLCVSCASSSQQAFSLVTAEKAQVH